MPSGNLAERLHYRTDLFLARGSKALFLSLLVTFLICFALIGGARLLFGTIFSTEHSVGRHPWFVFLQLTDPGNMAQDNDSIGVSKLAAIAAGMTGVVIFSALIAFLTTALDQAIAKLKKGHSRVLETGHTLILGWSPRITEILRELVEANESEDDPVVVILSEETKEDMDELLSKDFTDRRNTRVVTRHGPTASLRALDSVNAAAARSAILLASCGEAAPQDEKLASDAKIIKTVLALENKLGTQAECSVVAEVFDPRNRQVVEDVAPGRVIAIDAEEILAKVMVQTSRTSGLSVVYSELLSFEGSEIYFHSEDWGGIRFDELLFRFEEGVPFGIRRKDGALLVRPAPETVLEEGDDVLIVAEDDSKIAFSDQVVMTPTELPIPDRRVSLSHERMLILGWSAKAPIICSEYADYVREGSAIDVAIAAPSPALQAQITALQGSLEEVELRLIEKDPLVCAELESLDPLAYNNVVILPQKPEAELVAERIDAETIVVLLHLRKLVRQAEKAGRRVTTKVLTEVLDSSNQELINQAGVNDFLISNRMVSMIFAQLSEQPDIRRVYDDLFQEDGSEIYVKPASLYFDELPVTCRFGDLLALAQKRDAEVCLGYKIQALENELDENHGVSLVPPKDTEVTLRRGDALVVVAEDER